MRPSLRHLGVGVAAAVFLYGAGAVTARLLAQNPELAAQMAMLYGWKGAVPSPLGAALVVFIVLGEEIVWRSAVPALVCHILWDMAVLFWLPYVRP
jgi:membrane protease YdiL (CAAX protease family)